MGSEPKWLIGGPQQADQVTTPQQDVPKVTEKIKAPKVKTEGTYDGKTAQQWHELATDCTRRELTSRERCDTDGALSQYGNSLMARKYKLCARLAESDGLWEFQALFTLTGALVPDATYIRTRQGKWVWRIGKGEDAQWFNESRARDGHRRRTNDASKGFYVGLIRARGYVGTAGNGRGVSGLTSVGYFIGQRPNSPIEIVDSGAGHMNLGTQYGDEK